MLKIIYTKNGEPVNDFYTFDYVDECLESYNTMLSNEDLVIKISSEICLHVFILRLLENDIPIDNVEFYYEDEKLEFDPCCGLMEAKNKTHDYYYEVIDKILKFLYCNMKRSKGIED